MDTAQTSLDTDRGSVYTVSGTRITVPPLARPMLQHRGGLYLYAHWHNHRRPPSRCHLGRGLRNPRRYPIIRPDRDRATQALGSGFPLSATRCQPSHRCPRVCPAHRTPRRPGEALPDHPATVASRRAVDHLSRCRRCPAALLHRRQAGQPAQAGATISDTHPPETVVVELSVFCSHRASPESIDH